MKIHIFALQWRDEIKRSSQLRTLLKRVVVNRTWKKKTFFQVLFTTTRFCSVLSCKDLLVWRMCILMLRFSQYNISPKKMNHSGITRRNLVRHEVTSLQGANNAIWSGSHNLSRHAITIKQIKMYLEYLEKNTRVCSRRRRNFKFYIFLGIGVSKYLKRSVRHNVLDHLRKKYFLTSGCQMHESIEKIDTQINNKFIFIAWWMLCFAKGNNHFDEY